MSCLLKALFCFNGLSLLSCPLQIPHNVKSTYIDITILSTGSVSPKTLFPAVAAAESRFKVDAKSPAGAYGTFQIMPITERHVNQRYGLSLDRTIPIDNLMLGVIYLEEMYSMAGGDINRALAMYNWGPTIFARWEGRNGILSPSNMIFLPTETYNYIKRVNRYITLTQTCEQ